jgi:spermidine synthase
MIPWKHLATAQVPNSGTELRLYQHGAEFSIRVDRYELMNSRSHSSEDEFSRLGCARLPSRGQPRVLIGGLGLGYSLRGALNSLPADATVVVAELVPAVASWNREILGHLAGHPLRDPRVTLQEVDVARLLREPQGGYDLIMLDIDNGPQGTTRRANDWLYSRAGLLAARSALRASGVVGYWSEGPDQGFVRRLTQVGFSVEELSLRASNGHRGARHTVWFASAEVEAQTSARRR